MNDPKLPTQKQFERAVAKHLKAIRDEDKRMGYAERDDGCATILAHHRWASGLSDQQLALVALRSALLFQSLTMPELALSEIYFRLKGKKQNRRAKR